MTSINDSLSPDLLFNIFKRLDCIETTIVRRVCKRWFDIIDEHKSFWRTLHLPGDSLEKWDPSILELFDFKSASSLKTVDIRVDLHKEFQDHLFNTLEFSKETLRHLLILIPEDDEMFGDHFEKAVNSINTQQNLISLRIMDAYVLGVSKVHLRMIQTSSSDSVTSLKVLWLPSISDIIRLQDISRFQNLVSLDFIEKVKSSKLRGFLERPSKTLKHLGLSILEDEDEDEEAITAKNVLFFPALVFMELNGGFRFPAWVIVPLNLKIMSWSNCSHLPSISELWIRADNLSSNEENIVNCCPQLKVLRILKSPSGINPGTIIFALRKRRSNIEAGLLVEGMKMETIQTLVISFELVKTAENPNYLETLRQLVEVVVDGDSTPEIMEVEVEL